MLKIVAVISSTWLLASSSFIKSFTLSSNRSSYWEIKASYSSAYSALYKRVCFSLSLVTSSSFCITVSRDSQHQYLIEKQIDRIQTTASSRQPMPPWPTDQETSFGRKTECTYINILN
ncbi:hypothetical protein GIB67_012810 [Kingdonia uniflora]|uniref:Secreted protein n=1 Tax=Kingdonia uniflora TaxID=39325 RepID=A0A7J7NFS6_9MAGN|nr:hypothetical protein GIB67_012810 [Kingdonia uniflora]